MNLFNQFTILSDAPHPWGVYFQDSASPQMEALIELHDKIMFYLVLISVGVAWIVVSIITKYVYNKFTTSNKCLNQSILTDSTWIVLATLILLVIMLTISPDVPVIYCDSFDLQLQTFDVYNAQNIHRVTVPLQLDQGWINWAINHIHTIINEVRAENNLLTNLMNQRKAFLQSNAGLDLLNTNFNRIESKIVRMHRLIEVKFTITDRLTHSGVDLSDVFRRRFPTLSQISNLDKAEGYLRNPFRIQ